MMDDKGGSVEEESEGETRRVINLEEEEFDVELLFEESKKAILHSSWRYRNSVMKLERRRNKERER